MSNIKCPQCGLVNWATEANCKRCQSLLDAQDYAKPQYDSSLSLEGPPLFSGVVKVLTAILALATVGLLFFKIFHPFDTDTTMGIAAIFMLVGFCLLVSPVSGRSSESLSRASGGVLQPCLFRLQACSLSPGSGKTQNAHLSGNCFA